MLLDPFLFLGYDIIQHSWMDFHQVQGVVLEMVFLNIHDVTTGTEYWV